MTQSPKPEILYTPEDIDRLEAAFSCPVIGEIFDRGTVEEKAATFAMMVEKLVADSDLRAAADRLLRSMNRADHPDLSPWAELEKALAQATVALS